MTTDVQGWGWEWIKKTHLDQLEFKTGLEGETALFTLMTQTANEPDKKQKTGDYEDKLKKVAAAHEDGGDTCSRGWGYRFNPKKAAELLLRSHTTAISSRTLCSPDLKVPGK